MASKEVIAKKEAQVKDLADTLKASKLVLIVDYRGTSVADDTKLRKSLREAKGNSKVIKNNIIKRALDMNKESELDELLVGPNALIMAEEDYLTPLKVAYKFSKDHENYKIKGGIIEGKVMSVEEITTLAKLPSREELLSKLAGSLLQTITKVAVAIDQVRQQKEANGGETAKIEEKTEEATTAVEEKAEDAPAAEKTPTEEAPAEKAEAKEEVAEATEEKSE